MAPRWHHQWQRQSYLSKGEVKGLEITFNNHSCSAKKERNLIFFPSAEVSWWIFVNTMLHGFGRLSHIIPHRMHIVLTLQVDWALSLQIKDHELELDRGRRIGRIGQVGQLGTESLQVRNEFVEGNFISLKPCLQHAKICQVYMRRRR